MPAPAPTSLPVWATSGTIVTPSSGKQALGWVDVEHPEAEYLNWLFNTTYLWILWLSEYLVDTWYYVPAVIENVTAGPLMAHYTGGGSGTGVANDATLQRLNLAYSSSGSGNTFVPIRIYPKFGDKIYEIGATGNCTSSVGSVIENSLTLYYSDPSTGNVETVATSSGISLIANAQGNYTYTLGTPHTVVEGATYWLTFEIVNLFVGGGAGNVYLNGVGYYAGP